MPAMPRMSKKARKIVYSILGTPANMQKKSQIKDSAVNQRLIFEETTRIK